MIEQGPAAESSGLAVPDALPLPLASTLERGRCVTWDIKGLNREVWGKGEPTVTALGRVLGSRASISCRVNTPANGQPMAMFPILHHVLRRCVSTVQKDGV